MAISPEADFRTIFGVADSPIPQLLRITYGMAISRALTALMAAGRQSAPSILNKI